MTRFPKSSVFQIDFPTHVPGWFGRQQRERKKHNLAELRDVYAGWGNFLCKLSRRFGHQFSQIALLLPAVGSGAYTLTFGCVHTQLWI